MSEAEKSHYPGSYTSHEISATIINYSSDHFTMMLYADPAPIMDDDFIPEITVLLNFQPVKLPPVKILTVKRKSNVEYLVNFCCKDARKNKELYWRLKMQAILHGTNKKETEERRKLLPKRHLYIYTEKAKKKRLDYLEGLTGKKLTTIPDTRLNAADMTKSIEGFIGSVEIPLGIAGPILINGQYANGVYYAPCATTEGALVASISRGASAISDSGGATVRVLGQQMIRAPRFEFDQIDQSIFFCEWVVAQLEELRQQIKPYSRHAKLIKLIPQVMGRSVHLQFIYSTSTAAGQNMTTSCTWHACKWIQQQLGQLGLPLRHFMIEGNVSSDKKVSLQAYLHGRGTRVVAEVYLNAATCKSILRVQPEQLVQAYHHAIEGATATGMIGININAANVVAAMFTALGQDIACVHESSVAHLNMELTDNNCVYCSIVLPSLVIGTVGGGTKLPTQYECLNLLGCNDEQGSARLAEIIASFCLALDISTLSAIAADEFAKAHDKLGRQRRTKALLSGPRKYQDIDISFFRQAEFKPGLFDGAGTLAKVRPCLFPDNDSSLLTQMSTNHAQRLVGLFPFTLTSTRQHDVNIMLKLKPLGSEVITMIERNAQSCSPDVSEMLKKFAHRLEFNASHQRELEVMCQQDERFTRYIPRIYGTVCQPETGTYALIEELLSDTLLLNSIDLSEPWLPCHVEAAIRGIAEVHSIWLGHEKKVLKAFSSLIKVNAADMAEMQPLFLALGEFMHHSYPLLFTAEDWLRYKYWVAKNAEWWQEIEKMPRTLIHGDFNPRNIAFRENSGKLQLCAWDWELATLHLPQRDLAELLAFTLSEDADLICIDEYIELHRKNLEEFSGQKIEPMLWKRGFELALYDLWIRRIPFYMIAYHVNYAPFIEKIVRTTKLMLHLLSENKISLTDSE